MKLVVAWLFVLGLAVLTTTSSCSINHRSGDYACTKQSDCSGGRTCTGGFCVAPGGAVDAPVASDAPRVDAMMNVCPAQCTSCNFGSQTCTIDCAVNNCNGPLVCPTGWNCNIGCTTTNSCRGGIDCQNAASCSIACTGAGSCRNLDCGNNRCDVTCTGSASCRAIDCSTSCGCDVKCNPGAACDAVVCSSPQCDTGLGCSSTQTPQCNTCP